MEWISVNTRSPLEEGLRISNTVMVSDINSHPSIGFGHVTHDGVWTIYEGEHDFMNPATVTHWMPLPAPPKEHSHA